MRVPELGSQSAPVVQASPIFRPQAVVAKANASKTANKAEPGAKVRSSQDKCTTARLYRIAADDANQP